MSTPSPSSMSNEEIAALIQENRRLKETIHQLASSSSSTFSTSSLPSSSSSIFSSSSDQSLYGPPPHSLSASSISRYGRQLLLTEFGTIGQEALLSTKFLLIGAGGLGTPAALYLAAAGVGVIGLVDDDAVEISNLHRQIAHTELGAINGINKAQSCADACKRLNSTVPVIPYCLRFNSSCALSIINDYDIVLDCSDNAATRYIINDACRIAGKPLISASALRLEGQCTVYGFDDGPCYRCLFPRPPPPHTVTSCNDGGVLGVVTGIIGSIQALEAIKVAVLRYTQLKKASNPSSIHPESFGYSIDNFDHLIPLSQRLLLFDASSTAFRIVKLRPRRADCEVCGTTPSITRNNLSDMDYVAFCGAAANDKAVEGGGNRPETAAAINHFSCPAEKAAYEASLTVPNITVSKMKESLDNLRNTTDLILDVREPHQYSICHLPSSHNLPLRVIINNPKSAIQQIMQWSYKEKTEEKVEESEEKRNIFVLCRRGIDSVTATRILMGEKLLMESEKDQKTSMDDIISKIFRMDFLNVQGGLVRWSKQVDQNFPVY